MLKLWKVGDQAGKGVGRQHLVFFLSKCYQRQRDEEDEDDLILRIRMLCFPHCAKAEVQRRQSCTTTCQKEDCLKFRLNLLVIFRHIE